ncbi:conserved protein of unknown function [Limnospira indica PCC 8005]|uniref:Uncharacterized protein n=1 Tax=Limnospira indica PCC 8005 TaxID=376219 RepID=A0A9P1NXG4_9CYAN|nr:conserved protein of unknown function [Limnospira indica PCC 8005]
MICDKYIQDHSHKTKKLPLQKPYIYKSLVKKVFYIRHTREMMLQH